MTTTNRKEATMMLLTKAIRKQLPDLYAQDGKGGQATAYVKFFTPDSNWTWYATEFDGQDTFFGLVFGFEKELGYFRLSELQSAQGPMGLFVERDKWWKPKMLDEIVYGPEKQVKDKAIVQLTSFDHDGMITARNADKAMATSPDWLRRVVSGSRLGNTLATYAWNGPRKTAAIIEVVNTATMKEKVA